MNLLDVEIYAIYSFIFLEVLISNFRSYSVIRKKKNKKDFILSYNILD